MQKTANGTTTVSIYSGSQVLAEYDNGAAVSSPSREYIFADGVAGPGFVAMITGSTSGSGGTITYYHTDHLSIRLKTDANGNSITQLGHYPFGETWYNGEWVFTSYQHDSESGLDYALARYYNSRLGSFCSADPLEGWPEDPQSWNRYTYVRNDPVNLVDPSGRGWLSVVLEVLAYIVEAFTGAPTGDIAQMGQATAQIADVALLDSTMIRQAQNAGQEGQKKDIPLVVFPPPPVLNVPGAPDNYMTCHHVMVITGIGLHEAHGKGAGGIPPTVGDAAYNPSDFGLTKAQAADLDRGSGLIFKPDWSQARITGPNGTTIAPVPNKGLTQVPKGYPISTDSTIRGTDTVNPPQENHLDVYRYEKEKDAWDASRTVPTTIYVPRVPGAHCPK